MALWHAQTGTAWAFKPSAAHPLTPTNARPWRASSLGLMRGVQLQQGPTDSMCFPSKLSNLLSDRRSALLQQHAETGRRQLAPRPYSNGLMPGRSRCGIAMPKAVNQPGMPMQPSNHVQPSASQTSKQQDPVTSMHLLSNGAQLQPQRLSATTPPWSSNNSKAAKPSPLNTTRPQLQLTAASPASPSMQTSSKSTAASTTDGANTIVKRHLKQKETAGGGLDARAGAALADMPVKPASPWLRLLGMLVLLAGRVLHALAMAFCLVALLLLRPRAVGADSTSPGNCSPAAAQTAPDSSTSSSGAGSVEHHHQAIKRPARITTPPFASMTASMMSSSASWPAQPAQHSAAGRTAAHASVALLAADDVAAQQLDAVPPAEGSAGIASPAAAMLSGAALLAAQEAAVTALFKSAQASVVNISGARAAGTFSSLDVTRALPGVGSGFIWDDRGHVVTAYSCVRGAAEVKVTLADAATYTAKLVGWDAGKDVAVLRLSLPKARLKELVPIKLGSVSGPGGLALGAPVFGLGNASGLDHTLTQGIVSGLGRELPGGGPYPLKGLIQTDAACGHQSGGVLLNSQGRLVGMVVAPSQAGGRAAGYGLGYGLPIDSLRGLVAQILATGNQPTRPTLGVTLAPPQVLAAQGVDGVLVLEVPPGSPAAVAGLRHTHRDIFGDVILGDVIVGVEGMPVRHAGDLYAALDTRKFGDRVRIDILRDGKSTSLTVVLGERGHAGALEE